MRRLRGCATFLLTAGLMAFAAGLFYDGYFDVAILWLRDTIASGRLADWADVLPQRSAFDPATVAYDPVETADSDTGLWYQELSEAQRAAYGMLLEGLRGRQEEFVLEGCASADVEAAYTAIRGDHPELFWLGGYSYGEANGSTLVAPDFTVAQDQIDAMQAEIDRVADEALADIAEDASPYERLRHCFEWIVSTTDYAFSDRDQDITGVFLDHEAVCAGYSRALQYLLHRQGIRCDYVTGEANGRGSHGWNIVWLGDTPTYVDVTWGDPAFVGDDGSFLPGDIVLYDYLCLTTAEITRDHVAVQPAADLPRCDSTDYDYYRLGGTYLESFSALGLRELIAQAIANGRTTLRFKMGSWEAYQEALAFVSSQEVFRCFDEHLDGITYVNQDDLYIIGLDWNPPMDVTS